MPLSLGQASSSNEATGHGMSTNMSQSPSATQPILYLRMLRIAASKVPRYTLKGKIFPLRKTPNSQNHFLEGIWYGQMSRWASYVAQKSACQCKRLRRYGFDLWVGKIPWKRKWQPTPVFLPGKFHGHRSLTGYSP